MSAGAVKAGAAYVSIFADSTKLVRDLKIAEKKFRDFGSGVSSIGASLGSIGAGVAGLGTIGAAALSWPLQLASNMENAEAAFTTLLKDGERAKMLMGELEQFAASTPFQFDELADAAKKLLAFGSSAEDVQRELRAIGDISSAIGAPIGEIAEIYGKARVQGRLFAEDINQLTGRGIPIIQELAKQFGVTDQEVKKLVESGQVNFGNLEKAFVSLTNGAGQFAGGMERQSRTLSGSFSTLKDNIIAAFRPFGESLLPVAKEALGMASQAVQMFSKWAMENKGLAIPLAAASAALVAIGGAATAAGAAVAILGGAISAVGTLAGAAATVLAAVGGGPMLAAIAGAIAGWTAIGAAVGYVLHQTGVLMPVLNFLGQTFGRVFAVASQSIGGVVRALSSGEWGKAAAIAWAGVKLAVLTGAQQVLKGIDGLWNNAGKITWNFFKGLGTTVYNVFSNLPKIAWAALKGGAALADAIAGALGNAFDENGSLNLAGNLDGAVAGAQTRLNQLTAQQRAPGSQAPASPIGQRGQRQFAPRPLPQVPSVGPAVAAGTRAALPATAAAGGGGGGGGELGQLVALSQGQLLALRRLVSMGGLS